MVVADLLGEVDVPPRPLDRPDDGAVGDGAIAVTEGRDDVPVREDPTRVRVVDDGDDIGTDRLDDDASGRGRVDGRSVRRRDVDPEVEGAVGLVGPGDTRIAEERTDGVLAVERLERPTVRPRGRGDGACEGDGCGGEGDADAAADELRGGGHAATVRGGPNAIPTRTSPGPNSRFDVTRKPDGGYGQHAVVR